MQESVQLHASAALPPRKKTSERNKYDACGAPSTRQFEMEKNLLLLLGIEQRSLSYPVWDLLYRLRYSGIRSYGIL